MPNITELVRSEGFLYKDPTSLVDPSGYGTNLGYTAAGVDLYTNEEVFYSRNEEEGNNVWRKFYLGNTPRLLTFLRNYNADVLSVAGQGHSVGSKMILPGARGLGAEISEEACKIIFIPKNLAYPCIYARYASVQIYPGIAVTASHGVFTIFPAEIDCLPRGMSDALQYGKIGDIVL